jgi:trimethyllysine dioxygenase
VYTGPATVPHKSIYPWSWLKESSYDPHMPATSQVAEYVFSVHVPWLILIFNRKILWGSRIAQSPPTVSYEEVMSNDEQGLYKWLSNIDTFGFSFVSGVPVTPEATEELCQRIAFIRETQCEFFHSMSKMRA